MSIGNILAGSGPGVASAASGVGQSLASPTTQTTQGSGESGGKARWKSFLTRLGADQNRNQAMIAAGMQLLQGRHPSETGYAGYARAIGTGMETLQGLRQQEAEREMRERQLDMQERGVEQGDRRLDQGEEQLEMQRAQADRQFDFQAQQAEVQNDLTRARTALTEAQAGQLGAEGAAGGRVSSSERERLWEAHKRILLELNPDKYSGPEGEALAADDAWDRMNAAAASGKESIMATALKNFSDPMYLRRLARMPEDERRAEMEQVDEVLNLIGESADRHVGGGRADRRSQQPQIEGQGERLGEDLGEAYGLDPNLIIGSQVQAGEDVYIFGGVDDEGIILYVPGTMERVQVTD